MAEPSQRPRRPRNARCDLATEFNRDATAWRGRPRWGALREGATRRRRGGPTACSDRTHTVPNMRREPLSRPRHTDRKSSPSRPPPLRLRREKPEGGARDKTPRQTAGRRRWSHPHSPGGIWVQVRPFPSKMNSDPRCATKYWPRHPWSMSAVRVLTERNRGLRADTFAGPNPNSVATPLGEVGGFVQAWPVPRPRPAGG